MKTSLVGDAFVSLDLETTGLDPNTDGIIEIGAVKFRGTEVLDTFHSLVNPYRPLSHRVRRLTGITAQELEDAPPFAAVASDLSDFLGDCPIVGQNIGFDLSFLEAQGMHVPGPVYDILELARIMLPQLSDHTLSTLAKEARVDTPTQHRALADAITAKGVFLALIDRASLLHPKVMAEILGLTANSGWVWRPVLANLENAKRPLLAQDDLVQTRPSGPRGEVNLEPLVASANTKPLDADQLAQLLSNGNRMKKAFPSFEYRPGQVAMMQAIAQAMNTGQILIAEAGTGTGKSVAYLLPAIFFALQNRTHVVVSTNTINLQEQLVRKDIPDLLQALNLAESPQVTQLKGRSNYLCLKQWDSRRQSSGITWDEIRFMLRISVWLSSTSTGDRAEMNLNWDDMVFWNRICASEENCTPKACARRGSGCYLYDARRKAESSHVIVVNHALLLSDLVNASKILPEYRHLIIDEAHHLEDEATEQLGYKVSQWDIYNYLDRLVERNGTTTQAQNWLQRSPASQEQRRRAGEAATGVMEQGRATRHQVGRFFDCLGSLMQPKIPAAGQYEQSIRLVPKVRNDEGWERLEAAWGELNLQLLGIEAGMGSLCSILESVSGEEEHGGSSLSEDLLALKQRGQKLRQQIDAIVAKPDEDRIDWASLREPQEAALHAAPLRVGQSLERQLFSQKECVVLTSATLSTGGSFEYIEECLGLHQPDELMVESPFDYRTSALIYLPEGIPAPNNPKYQKILELSVLELCKATHGRALLLFTSHAALRATYAAIQPELEQEDILLLGQGIDGSPKQLLNAFKANSGAVLLGTASLWEGIDVVGDALSVVVIAKLPFPVPSDPIFSARSELFDDPFNQYAVPQAILRFKQGFGRLIRSRNDRGAIVLLDSRLQKKAYGKVFLESLPSCTVISGPVRNMPREVVGWLGAGGSERENMVS